MRIVSSHHFSQEYLSILDVCILGFDFSKCSETIVSIIETMKKKPIRFQITLLDYFGYFSHQKEIDKILSQFENIRILNVKKTTLVGSINDYLEYTQSKYILFLPSGGHLEYMDVTVFENIEQEPIVLGYSPKIMEEKEEVESAYQMDDFSKMDLYQNSFLEKRAVIAPYNWTWLVSKEKLKIIGTLESSYEYLLSTGIDFFFRAFSEGYEVRCSKKIVITIKKDEMKEKLDILKFKEDKLLLYSKNINSYLNRFLIKDYFQTLPISIGSYFSFFKLILRILWIKKNNNLKLRKVEDITKILSE